MATFVTKKVAKHVLKENAANRFGTEDPYFEHIAAVDLNGRATGKFEKRKRAAPPGLTKQEEKVLKKVTRRAYRLDNCLNICGIRVGWSAVIGLIPAAGDIIDALMAFMVVWTATDAKIPASLKSRMIFNIALDFAVGLVPVVGDVADAFYRCNTKNAALLWKHLQKRGAARIESGEVTDVDVRARSSSRRGAAKSPGRNKQAVRPANTRNDSRQNGVLSQPVQARAHSRGRGATVDGESPVTPSSRPHSTRRGRGELSAAHASQAGKDVTTNDFGASAEKQKAGKKSWRAWLMGDESARRDASHSDPSEKV